MRVFLWWLLPDLNWGHKALQASALPTELKSLNWFYSDYSTRGQDFIQVSCNWSIFLAKFATIEVQIE